jgi:hypothetical protein
MAMLNFSYSHSAKNDQFIFAANQTKTGIIYRFVHLNLAVIPLSNWIEIT